MSARTCVTGLALVVSCWGCFPELPGRAPVQIEAGDVELPDAADVGAAEAGLDMPQSSEQCNGQDDDRDGTIDEDFVTGEACTVGQGACVATGQTICRPDGRAVVCDVSPGMPGVEVCNGLDDDCSDGVDEGFDVGSECEAGFGPCRVVGEDVCLPDGSGVECSVTADLDRVRLERCDGVDDDCDGEIDEGLDQNCTLEVPGLCAAGRKVCEDGEWGPCVGTIMPGERNDVCNGVDDDCDGSPDENQLADGPEPCDNPQRCVDIDGCIPTTPCVTQCDPDSVLNTICAQAPETTCDGIDNDCDGAIDDKGVCGGVIEQNCQLLMGWTDRALEAPARDWGMCDFDRGLGDGVSCNRSRPGDFVTFSLPEGADIDGDDDRLGVAFRCDGDGVPAYVAAHCRIYLGVSAVGVGIADGAEAWGPCPAALVEGDETIACTSSTLDGDFQPLLVPFDLAAGGYMGVAFVCEDLDDPARARAMAASIEVMLAWADASVDRRLVDWETACAPLGDGDPYTTCARARGDGRFGVMRLTADVDAGDRFAIMIQAR